MSSFLALAELIDATPWLDTHEHLVEERHRLGSDPHFFRDAIDHSVYQIPADWSSLIIHYALDDLVSAGLRPDALRVVTSTDEEPLTKWNVVAPYFEASRTTGYLRAVDITTERLFGLRLASDTCEEIDRACRKLRQPGYYERVLRHVANVERCQVNSADVDEDPFCITDGERLLDQDLCIFPLVCGRHDRAERLSGIEVASLDDYVAVVEWCFEQYAPLAVAVKCAWAYSRPMAVRPPDAPPAWAFQRVRRGSASPRDRRCVEDFLFGRCLELAAKCNLPVKLHLGYMAGNRQPQMAGLAGHVNDVTALVQANPRNTFVLMHTAWPHHESLLALAKHSPNVIVDLSFAWILAPFSTQEFLCRFITTAPPTKLLCFGGDYLTVESVVGHAEIARRGLQKALERLCADSWLTADDALGLVPMLMRDNASRLFYARDDGVEIGKPAAPRLSSVASS